MGTEYEDSVAGLNSRILKADSQYEILRNDNDSSLAEVDKLNGILSVKDENIDTLKSKVEETTNNLNQVENSLQLIRSESEEKSLNFKLLVEEKTTKIETIKKELHDTKAELQLSKEKLNKECENNNIKTNDLKKSN